ncbi:MAG: uL15m family ribosomal protein [Nanoarchaeota archaeon]
MKTKKRKKSTRYRGSYTHGRGGKKKARGSGHRGGKGMAGTGKRADQRKSLVINLYKGDYFGKAKTLRRKKSKKLKTMNLRDISDNFSSLIEKGAIKEIKKGEYEIDLKGYKILGDGEITTKLTIIASEASKSAKDKVKKAGGDIRSI